MNFKELGLNDKIVKALKAEKITSPTKIQEAVYTKITENVSLAGKSYTGSGKTLAYLLPLYQKSLELEKGNRFLILTPTHELAFQINKQIQALNKNSGYEVSSVVITGNVNISRQIESLRSKQTFVIGTPGRIEELIKKRKIAAHLIQTLVIDEGDRLLDDHNIEAVKQVRKTLMRDTQVLAFSASFNEKVLDRLKQMSHEPEFIESGEKNAPDSVKHMYIVCEPNKKVETVRSVINALKPKKSLIFVNGEYTIEEITNKLKYHHYKADCVYGKTGNTARKNILNSFINGKLDYLVATDIAARGIHIDGIDVVINVTMPEDSDSYLHRSGRCGRNGMQGVSISIITEKELSLIKKYQKDLKLNFIERTLFKGKLVKA